MIWPFKKKAKSIVEPWHRSKSFERQMHFEGEGALAFQPDSTKNNPYNRDTQSFEWNHWDYGWSIAKSRYDGPMVDSVTGHGIFLSTAELTPAQRIMLSGSGGIEMITHREWLERQAKKDRQ